MRLKSTIFAVAIGLATAMSHFGMTHAAALNPAPVLTGDVNLVDVHYRRYRHSHRRNRGAGIAGAIIGGAIIGAAIADSNRRSRRSRRRGNAHINWCYDRYRSYRAYDDTFQPYRGGRRYCRSPYS